MEVERQSSSIVDCKVSACGQFELRQEHALVRLRSSWFLPALPGRYKRHARCECCFGGDGNGTKRGGAEVVNVATALFFIARGATIKWGVGRELTRIRIWEGPASDLNPETSC